MSWKETDPMHQRHLFIDAYQTELYSVSELAERYGISRKTAYKWINRFEAAGSAGLADRRRTPVQSPHRLPAEIQHLFLELRREHPRWGPITLRAVAASRHPELKMPAASTIGELLKRHHLISPRTVRRKLQQASYCSNPIVAEAPNALWCIDFKGEFRLGNRQYCYPLTLSDAYSRMVLECYGLRSTAHDVTKRRLTLLFQQYGLPEAIRSDNGGPFVAARAPLGISRLSLWWAKLGIQHQRIQPAHPQQNARHERMHRTLKAETTRPPAQTFAAQQQRFDAWRAEYNQERPHQGIGLVCPATLYQASQRSMPSRLPSPQYAAQCAVRRVGENGTIRFKGRQVFLSVVLIKEQVALEEVDDGIWNVLLYDVVLGRFNERDYQLH